MGLTFEKNNQLDKMLDKFAILPDDPKKRGRNNQFFDLFFYLLISLL